MSDNLPQTDLDKELEDRIRNMSFIPKTPTLPSTSIADPGGEFSSTFTLNPSFTYGDTFTTTASQFEQQFTKPISPIPFDENHFSAPGNLDPTRQIGVLSPQATPSVPKSEEGFGLLTEGSHTSIYSIINLLNEYVLSHPFVIVRRQAQVNNRSIAHHLTPFTVIPLMLRIEHSQGISAFFKGLPSVLVNYVLLIGSESLFYNLLQYPIEFDFGVHHILSQHFLKHIILKSLSILVVTPFICSSSVETVQSTIVTESSSPLDHIREGFSRIFHFKNDRKLPFYLLIGPSILYHLSYYIIYSLTREVILRWHFNEERRVVTTKRVVVQKESQFFGPTSEVVETTEHRQQNRLMIELKSSLYANFLTDIVLYPFQTILFRLFLQGTRTLIDNVDGRTAVIPLISDYDSALDCYHSIQRFEGSVGLFKGFGALLLQYTVQASLIHLANYCVDFIVIHSTF